MKTKTNKKLINQSSNFFNDFISISHFESYLELKKLLIHVRY